MHKVTEANQTGPGQSRLIGGLDSGLWLTISSFVSSFTASKFILPVLPALALVLIGHSASQAKNVFVFRDTKDICASAFCSSKGTDMLHHNARAVWRNCGIRLLSSVASEFINVVLQDRFSMASAPGNEFKSWGLPIVQPRNGYVVTGALSGGNIHVRTETGPVGFALFAEHFVSDEPQGECKDEQQNRGDSENDRRPSEPPIKKRLLVSFILLVSGIVCSLGAGNALYEDRIRRSALLFLAAGICGLGAFGVFMLNTDPRTWGWWL